LAISLPGSHYPFATLAAELLPGAWGTSSVPIQGDAPDPLNFPAGCRFHPRCPKAFDRCQRQDPRISRITGRHEVACHLMDRAELSLERQAMSTDCGDSQASSNSSK
jgi:oligopeptide/dipeptide ABC transporter ATP-binding protein